MKYYLSLLSSIMKYSNLFLKKHLLSPTICFTENRSDNVLKQSLVENVGNVLRSSSVSLSEHFFLPSPCASFCFVGVLLCCVCSRNRYLNCGTGKWAPLERWCRVAAEKQVILICSCGKE